MTATQTHASGSAADAARLCRFVAGPLPAGDVPIRSAPARIGAVVGAAASMRIVDLTDTGIVSLAQVLDAENPAATLRTARAAATREHPLPDVMLLAPVERQEIWAAGVTYLRSKTARMEESDFSATAYDRVYEAERPELFFKSLGEKAVGNGDRIGIRGDSRWNVPEPELVLVLDPCGRLVGCTVGNDVSSRDIEGANLLYLPQAKVYDRSCAIGPWIALVTDEAAIRGWTIAITIVRDGREVFAGQTGIEKIKRSFADLIGHLRRSQSFPTGAMLLTGTGIVPDESFTLQPGDRVAITISGIGTLENTVVTV